MMLVAVTVVISIWISLSMGAASPWDDSKFSHQSRSLTNSKLTTLSSLSDLSRLQQVELPPLLRERVPGTAGIRAVREHLLRRLEALDFTVDVDKFYDRAPNGDNIEFVNIVATSNPAARRRLVLACHYDSKNDTGFIGATDAAVPCAMLLDIAHTLGSYLTKSENLERDLTLQLIFFDGEEAFETWTDTDSLYGSRHLASVMENTNFPDADSPTNMLDSIEMLVLLDLLGTQDCRIYSLFDDTKSEFEKLLTIEDRLSSMNLLSGTGSDIFRDVISFSFGVVDDDHLPFLQRGVRVLHLVPVPFPIVWHTPHDDERSLHYPTIDNISKILTVFVAEYLGADLYE